MADDSQTPSPESGGGTAPAPAGTQATNAPTADEIRAQARAELLAELKAATGHDSISGLKSAAEKAEADRLAEQGKFKELAEARAAELTQLRAERDGERVRNAILAASTDSVDPSTVEALLSRAASVDDKGTVTVGGKPVAEAVKALLAEKPHLAKPASGQGSGAGAGGAGAKGGEAPKRADYASEIDYHRAVAKHRAAQEG